MTPSTYMNNHDCELHFLDTLPTHWQQLRLKHLVRVFGGGTPSKERDDFWQGTIPWVSPRDMKRLRIEKALHNISVEAKQSANLPDVPKESVLLVTRGMILAHSFPIAIAGTTVTINQDMKALVPSKRIEPAYLASLLAAIKPMAFEYVDSAAHGTKRLDWEKFRSVILPVPPLPEQRAITAFLDHETARIDALIEEQQRLNQLLSEKRKSLISHVLSCGLDSRVPSKSTKTDGLDNVPSHWNVTRLKFLVREPIQMGPYGSSLTQLSVSDTGFKLYGQENYISGDFTRGTRWIYRDQFESLQSYELLPEDLVFSRKGSIGNCRLVPSEIERGIIDSDSIRVRVNRKAALPEFISLLSHEAAYIEEQFRSGVRGAIVGGLNTSNIANLVVAVPPLREQKEILEHIEYHQSQLNQMLDESKKACDLHVERRSAIISSAVTGQIDLREWDHSRSSPENVLSQVAETEDGYG